MTDSERTTTVRGWLSEAAQRPEGTNGPHFVDDPNTLQAWSLGKLPKELVEDLLDHMTGCAYCRGEVHTMMRLGMLELPPVEDDQQGPGVIAPGSSLAEEPVAGKRPVDQDVPIVSLSQSQRIGWMQSPRRWAVAAVSLLLLIGMLTPAYWWQCGRHHLSVAQAELDAGRASESLEHLNRAADYWSFGDVHRRTMHLYDEAFRTSLASGRFSEVVQHEQLVRQRFGPSPEWTNLRIQAMRSVSTEQSLSRNGRLLGYGYGLDGVVEWKQTDDGQDDNAKEINTEFRQAIVEHQDSLELRLNYGQFLLANDVSKEALSQFEAAVALDPTSAYAHLGLGLAQFRTRHYQDALDSFRQAARQGAQAVDCAINAALCLERLERPEDARTYWAEAARLVEDPELRSEIIERAERTP